MLSRIVTTPQSLLRQPGGKSKGDMCLWLESLDKAIRHAIGVYSRKGDPEYESSNWRRRPGFRSRDHGRPIKFHEWLGDSWAMLFSHPKDFTPVARRSSATWRSSSRSSTSATSKVIGLSVDPVDAHAKWADDIKETQGHAPNYPMIGDTDLDVSRSCTACCPRSLAGLCEGRTAADNQTVRNVFVIGPGQEDQARSSSYPMTTAATSTRCCA